MKGIRGITVSHWNPITVPYQNKKRDQRSANPLILLRSQGSNLGPSGYEPDELPLLYFAMWVANVHFFRFPPKLIYFFYKSYFQGYE